MRSRMVLGVVSVVFAALALTGVASSDSPSLRITQLSFRSGGFLGSDPTFYVRYTLNCSGGCLIQGTRPKTTLHRGPMPHGALVGAGEFKPDFHAPRDGAATGSVQLKPLRRVCPITARATVVKTYTVLVSTTVLGASTRDAVSDFRSIRVTCRKAP